MANPNPYFELVKNEGKYDEHVLCISRDKYLLNELKVEYIKKQSPRANYIVRPQIVKLFSKAV